MKGNRKRGGGGGGGGVYSIAADAWRHALPHAQPSLANIRGKVHGRPVACTNT